jgi:hypothetical protein
MSVQLNLLLDDSVNLFVPSDDSDYQNDSNKTLDRGDDYE